MLTKEQEKRVNMAIKETERTLEKAVKNSENAARSLEMEIADNKKLGNPDSANNHARERLTEYEAEVTRLKEHISKLEGMKTKPEPVYYFYNGFGKPFRINPDDTTITSNYLGDITARFKEEHDTYVNDSDEEYNYQMNEYNVFRNPKLKELQEANRIMGLDENTYLEDFIKEN